ncbi:membrane protein of ER body-like protein isoform X2 [Salvia miltiorrhiza]|uniref:membrane protein of ER body-like protein isoform X2 n=1 Tax=Salvia miltiorrhiza TaxID=226208 RepID=UPI0025AB9F08|nr:membrane protein of ER body-like protein isoform X2 [Salvia miltiorrhiza]
MEVVHRRVEEDEQLLPRRRRADLADRSDDDGGESSDDMMDGGYEVHHNVISDEKSVYFDDKKDTKLQWSETQNHEEMSKLVNDVINRQNLENFKAEILTVSTRESVVVEESDDEEVIELEFERAVEKVHTHTPYCPNCSNQITKVILRRKKKASPRPDKPLDLLGCLSCFSIFIPSGDCLNPFGLFKSKPKVETPIVEDEQPPISVGGTTTITNAGGSTRGLESPNVGPSNGVGSTTTNAPGRRLNPFKLFGSNSLLPKLESPKTGYEQQSTDVDEATTNNDPGILGEAKPEHSPAHATVDIPEIRGLQQPLIPGIRRSKPMEMLKCIVYGGLIESIASLSIVSSAAASDATTLNVVVIGLATLLSGVFAFACNLVELRNDCSDDKYEEVLGRRGHFAFHSTFALLSYLVFGLVAPTTFAFAFRVSDDRDYKILAVAAAAFACIFILSIAKAYVKGTERFGGYVKTTLYYVTLAVSASGVAYAAGDLFGMVFNDLGWFQHVDPPLSVWASY